MVKVDHNLVKISSGKTNLLDEIDIHKGGYTLQKNFHGTENFPRTACAVRFFL